jgi:hypothetical protein
MWWWWGAVPPCGSPPTRVYTHSSSPGPARGTGRDSALFLLVSEARDRGSPAQPRKSSRPGKEVGIALCTNPAGPAAARRRTAPPSASPRSSAGSPVWGLRRSAIQLRVRAARAVSSLFSPTPALRVCSLLSPQLAPHPGSQRTSPRAAAPRAPGRISGTARRAEVAGGAGRAAAGARGAMARSPPRLCPRGLPRPPASPSGPRRARSRRVPATPGLGGALRSAAPPAASREQTGQAAPSSSSRGAARRRSAVTRAPSSRPIPPRLQ